MYYYYPGHSGNGYAVEWLMVGPHLGQNYAGLRAQIGAPYTCPEEPQLNWEYYKWNIEGVLAAWESQGDITVTCVQ